MVPGTEEQEAGASRARDGNIGANSRRHRTKGKGRTMGGNRGDAKAKEESEPSSERDRGKESKSDINGGGSTDYGCRRGEVGGQEMWVAGKIGRLNIVAECQDRWRASAPVRTSDTGDDPGKIDPWSRTVYNLGVFQLN